MNDMRRVIQQGLEGTVGGVPPHLMRQLLLCSKTADVGMPGPALLDETFNEKSDHPGIPGAVGFCLTPLLPLPQPDQTRKNTHVRVHTQARTHPTDQGCLCLFLPWG